MVNRINKKKNNTTIYLIVALIIIIMICIISNLISNKREDNVNESYEQTEEEVEVEEQENITADLENMEERDRMEYYFGIFLGYIESQEYEKAYDLLYPEFKENYFPTVDSFTEYVQKTFPEMADIEHDNIERNGEVYVLWIYITDALNGKPGEKKEMNIVIKENDYNDFVMSFSVI